jgi:hypothetical protein
VSASCFVSENGFIFDAGSKEVSIRKTVSKHETILIDGSGSKFGSVPNLVLEHGAFVMGTIFLPSSVDVFD